LLPVSGQKVRGKIEHVHWGRVNSTILANGYIMIGHLSHGA
jgi:hypothetical protein